MTTVKSRQPLARRALLALAIASQGAGLAATNAHAERWFINADIKYLDIDTRAEFVGTTSGNLAVDVDIDPVVFGLGVGYRF